MMNNIFNVWNEMISEDFQKEIEDAGSKSSGEYEEVPHGKYEVSIEKMELKATKTSNKPMVSIWMNIVSKGKFEGYKLFMNQVITQPFQVHIVNEFLRSLLKDCKDAPVIEFKNYTQYAGLLMDIHEKIADNFEYAVDYGQNKGFDTFKIFEVYSLVD